MADNQSFVALLQRVRAGDEAAATELVRQYEPAIRRTVRMRLTDPRLGRLLDSMDICQSVFASFFVRVASGQYELQSPEQLLRLLGTMARNKLLNHAEKQRAARRDQRRLHTDGSELLDAVPGGQATASRIASGKELLQRVRDRLTPEERFLADQRAQGHEWAEIAQTVQGNPEALRKKLSRALDRVARHLGLEEAANE
jgi:RNA polymerase sigma-70 factor (ECF subfamily)